MADLLKRPVESQVLERFLACGDLHKGFARIYCDQCGHDYLLAYGEWLEDNLLALVPHRQYVFTLPKLVRPFFHYRRRYPGDLCRLVAVLLKAGYTAMDPRAQPAFILYVQTFGGLVTCNPHMTATDGGNAGNAGNAGAITCPCPGC